MKRVTPSKAPSWAGRRLAGQASRLQSATRSRPTHLSQRPGHSSTHHDLHPSAAGMQCAGSRRATVVQAAPPQQQGGGGGEGEDVTPALVLGGMALTLVVLAVLRFGGDVLSDADAWAGVGGFAAGDVLGAALWSLSLYYCSPIQLLLLFLGRIDTDRPSDWVQRQLGLAANLDVDAIDYLAPLPIRAAVLASTGGAGILTAWAFEALLGDATWSISAGIGACFAAAVYEVGRPERLSVEEAQVLELQWQDFKVFADDRLRRSGRCHETEIFRAFRSRHGRYRSEEVLDDARLRDMVRNWHAGVDRSRSGWYKNVSFQPVGLGDGLPAAAASDSL